LTLSTPTDDDDDDGVECAQNAPRGDEQPSVGNLSTDITLTALAQLGIHRLACNRSFVSIIDGGNQHIIAEATGSISLRDKDKHLPNDGLYLGAQSLDLIWGVCPHAISVFTGRDMSCAIDTDNITANRTRYIIRDLKQEEMFKDRPYVRAWPYMRFYAEVPLYSPSGFVLGSYCVIDDKPREEFSEDEVNTLREVADAVARHLEHVRIVHCHRRSERLIKGLTNFVKDHADFDPREVSNDHRLEAMAVASNVNTSPPDDSPGPMEATLNQQFGFVTSSSTSLSEQPSPMFFAGPASGSTEPSSLNSTVSDRRSSPGEEKSIDEVLKAGPQPLEEVSNNASQLSLAESTSLGERIERIFQRASVLLRKSMDLDGVVFLDAARTNPSLWVVTIS
jgi:hypothetical protein